ncbi:MAG: hypothetical protein B7Y43_15245 [Sphingomonas sp. 28-62-20]|uniref:DUF3489 domain-containing protein n=1 Tax=Sphingomonas sp. 28-62-20 TaxID=1970433 RepID=UPI000BC421AB|nr:MAG: hypothetical protein B7Y43_15245 [Sphingomonas sp. 28-62-20]
MPKLNDTQLILLSAAARLSSGSLMPVPDSIAGAGDRAAKAITALVKQGLVEERETNDAASVHRNDGDVRYGVFITEAGLGVIDTGRDVEVEEPAAATAKPVRQSKSATLIALLERNDGATMADLIGATDWLPHTTRAALTGLRKKGHVIERGKRGDETFYRIAATA